MSNSNSTEVVSNKDFFQCTVVDRSIHATFPTELTLHTPSSSSKIPPKFERLHRMNGTALLSHAAVLLRLNASIYATSTTLFHRFYHRRSLVDCNVWGVAMACTLLACKIEEKVQEVRSLILVYVHLYRRFRLGLFSKPGSRSESFSSISSYLVTAQSDLVQQQNIELDETQNILRYMRPMQEKLYRAWCEELIKMEHLILRELGFSLHWIPDGHPHVFLLYFLKVLEVENETCARDSTKSKDGSVSMGQIAWNYCNDSCRLDFCVRYPPEVTACAAIHLACVNQNIHLPQSPRPWWQVFIGLGQDGDLSNVCNALLALHDEEYEGYYDVMRKFVVSLVEVGSFNDPDSTKGSFVWNSFGAG